MEIIDFGMEEDSAFVSQLPSDDATILDRKVQRKVFRQIRKRDKNRLRSGRYYNIDKLRTTNNMCSAIEKNDFQEFEKSLLNVNSVYDPKHLALFIAINYNQYEMFYLILETYRKYNVYISKYTIDELYMVSDKEFSDILDNFFDFDNK